MPSRAPPGRWCVTSRPVEGRWFHQIIRRREPLVATRSGGGSIGGIGLGGILVIAGILVAIFGSFWLGVIIVLVGLIAFGGFAKGKWY